MASLSENYSQVFSLFEGNDIDRKWFDEYDTKHYSLENKLIKMNKTIIEKIDKKEWKDDYILKESDELYDV
ncbi:MAG: hypothetical protein K8F36_11980 [Melioribacteraceae bacterium]|nr:hypothetical protein [Melioribacteraceae bacterium]